MSSVPANLRDDPWYRLVRCLVVLYVAALERRIARLLARMDALPMDPRFDAEFSRLDDRCYGLECLRDHYLAWLADPEVGLPRFRAAYDGVLPRGFAPAPRADGDLVARGHGGGVARRRGRLRCALVRPLDRPGGGDGAWALIGGPLFGRDLIGRAFGVAGSRGGAISRLP